MDDLCKLHINTDVVAMTAEAHDRRRKAPPPPRISVPKSTTTITLTTSTAAFIRFNCQADVSHWETGWSNRKKQWCCDHLSGCPTTTTGPHKAAASQPKFDCIAGYSNWQDGWSPEKQTWCCDHHDRGCVATTTPMTIPSSYDCLAGYYHWQDTWSKEKQIWCCHHKGRACETRKHFDCRDRRQAWTATKKSWCCANEDLGCGGAGVTVIWNDKIQSDEAHPQPASALGGASPFLACGVVGCLGLVACIVVWRSYTVTTATADRTVAAVANLQPVE